MMGAMGIFRSRRTKAVETAGPEEPTDENLEAPESATITDDPEGEPAAAFESPQGRVVQRLSGERLFDRPRPMLVDIDLGADPCL